MQGEISFPQMHFGNLNSSRSLFAAPSFTPLILAKTYCYPIARIYVTRFTKQFLVRKGGISVFSDFGMDARIMG